MYPIAYKNILFQVKHCILCSLTNSLRPFLRCICLYSCSSNGNKNLKVEYSTIIGRCCPKNNNSGSVPIILLIWHCLPMRERPKRWL